MADKAAVPECFRERSLVSLPSSGSPAEAASAQQRLVAREGFEPSKPLGRQIYSLLRLTASLPRLSTSPTCNYDRQSSSNRMFRASSSAQIVFVVASCQASSVLGEVRNLELAKGFEPPTG